MADIKDEWIEAKKKELYNQFGNLGSRHIDVDGLVDITLKHIQEAYKKGIDDTIDVCDKRITENRKYFYDGKTCSLCMVKALVKRDAHRICKNCRFWNDKNGECKNDIIWLNKPEGIFFNISDLKTNLNFGCNQFKEK
jgi:hypothetical protein